MATVVLVPLEAATPPPGAAATATLTHYRRAVAPRLGPYAQGTAGALSTTTVLECATWPFKSSLAQDDLWADQYLFRPDALAADDRTRVVATATTSTGLFSPDAPWTAAPYAGAGGETVEFHGLVPPVVDGVNDLHALINEALKTILLVVEVTVTPTADAQRHALGGAAPWLTEPAFVYEVGVLAAHEDREAVDPFRRPVRGSAEVDGGGVYLNHPGRTFRPDDTLWLRVLKPAYFHCRAAGGTFGDQAGLAFETDEAVPQTEWVTAATLVQAWLRLANVLAPADSQRAGTELAKAAAQVSRFQRNYLQAHLPKRTFKPLLNWGPRRWR